MESPGKELVERARGGDAAAFAALIRAYERVALAVAFGVLGDPVASGDVVQDAFVRAWERLADLRETQRFGAWLCGIVRNLAVDAVRRRKPTEPIEAAQAAEAEKWTHDPLDEIGRRERRAKVIAAIASLDEVSRPVVVLRYYEGLASSQIAELLETTPAAVDMRLSRARKQLKALLGDLDDARPAIQNEPSRG